MDDDDGYAYNYSTIPGQTYKSGYDAMHQTIFHASELGIDDYYLAVNSNTTEKEAEIILQSLEDGNLEDSPLRYKVLEDTPLRYKGVAVDCGDNNNFDVDFTVNSNCVIFENTKTAESKKIFIDTDIMFILTEPKEEQLQGMLKGGKSRKSRTKKSRTKKSRKSKTKKSKTKKSRTKKSRTKKSKK